MINLLVSATERLAAAQADYEDKLANAPDMRAAQAAIAAFRIEHAALKCQREVEFTALQARAKALAEAKAELIRATRAVAREEVSHATKAKRDEKQKEEAREEDRQAGAAAAAAAYEVFYQKCLLENPNALQERADREAKAAANKKRNL